MTARRTLVALGATVATAAALVTTAPWAAAEKPAGAPGKAEAPTAFLELEGVAGDATQPGFVGQIALTTVSFGASDQGGSSQGGGGAGAGKVAVSEVSLTKQADGASVPLLALLASGNRSRSAVLTLCGDEACSPATREVVRLDGVQVQTVSQAASGRTIGEQVSLVALGGTSVERDGKKVSVVTTAG